MKYLLIFMLHFPVFVFAQNSPTLLWTEYYGGDYSDAIYCITESSDGHLLMSGYKKNAINGNYDIYILKTDMAGTTIWELEIYNNFREKAIKIIESSDGNYVILITVYHWGSGLSDSWLIKVDTEGNILWQQEYDGYYIAIDFVETDDSGFLILGNGHNESISQGFWLLRVDTEGEILWNYFHPYPSIDFPVAEVASIINNEFDNNYFISGTCFVEYNERYSFIGNIDDEGNIIWIAEGNTYILPFPIKAIQNDEEIYSLIITDETTLLEETDVDGNFIGSIQLLLNEPFQFLTDFDYVNENGFLLAGSFHLNNSEDVFLVQTDLSGVVLWEQNYDLGFAEGAYSLHIVDETFFYITGRIVYEGINWCDSFLTKFQFNNTSITEEIFEIDDYNLQNHPNPFNPSTTINFSNELNEQIEIVIFNLKGQKVKTFLINPSTDLPINSITWNGDDNNGIPVSSGIYFYKLNVNGKIEAVKKCLLLK